MPLKPSLISTEADLLVNLLKDVKEISFADAAKELGVQVETVEAWAAFLEEEHLLSVKYKFTTPYLSYIEENEKNQTDLKKPAFDLFSEKKDVYGAHEVDQILNKSVDHLKAGEFKLAGESFSVLVAKLKKLLDAMSKGSGLKKEEYEPHVSEITARVKKAEELVNQGKFDIAKSIYDETIEKAKTILESARSLKKEQDSQIVISKEKGSNANALLDAAYKMIEQGRLEDSKKVYTQLKNLYYNLPQDFLEKKNELEQDLMKLNRDLAANLERAELKSMNEGSSRIREQMAIASGSIKRKDFQKANQAYEIIKTEFEKLPEGFLQEKRLLRNQIITLYEVLVTNRKRVLSSDMSAKAMRIDAMLDGIRNNMAARNINGAIALYNQVQALYSSLPMGFLKEKIDIQKKILKVYYKLSSDYKNYNMKLLDMESSEITKLLAQMQECIGRSAFKDAEKIYDELKKRYEHLPKGFLQEKTSLQNKILKAYSELISKSEQVTTDSINSNIAEMSRMITEAERYLKSKQYDLAHRQYGEIISLYNNLPSGFIKSKADLRTKILTIYKEITINYDQPFLKRADKSSDQAYHEVLRLILDIHHAIGKGEFMTLESGYNQIQSIINKTDFDAEQKTRLMQEIGKLGQEYTLYRKLSALDSLATQKNYMKLKVELFQIMRIKQRLKVSSPEDKPLFDFADRKFKAYYTIIKNMQQGLPSASFSRFKRKVPAGGKTIYQKIHALKTTSAVKYPGGS